MNKEKIEWNNTRKLFLKWLFFNELRKEFYKSIKFDGLSLWWITKLINKDIILDNQWYSNLNSLLNKKEVLNLKDYNNFFIFKLFKNFSKNLLIIFFINFFFKKKKNISNINCFHSYERGLIKYKKKYIDLNYSLSPLNSRKENSYLIELSLEKETIFNYFKIKNKLNKLKINYSINHHYISFAELFKIYFKIFYLFIKTKNILKKKNFFIINNIDCSKILKKKLLESFFGEIQESLIRGVSIKNFLEKNYHKNFITVGEFFPGYRSVYYFINKLKIKTKIVSIQHGLYSLNHLFYSIHKNEFFNNINSLDISPKPDIFLTESSRYYNFLKKIFSKKNIFILGNFKHELTKIKYDKDKINKKVSQFINNSKKIISICTAIREEEFIINILNKCDLSKFNIILCPHPFYKDQTYKIFKEKSQFNFNIIPSVSTREIIIISDVVISGSSSVAYEALYKKKAVIRVCDYSYPPIFDDYYDGIPIFSNHKNLQNYLNKNKFNNLKFLPKRTYKTKLNKNIHKRFRKIINNI